MQTKNLISWPGLKKPTAENELRNRLIQMFKVKF